MISLRWRSQPITTGGIVHASINPIIQVKIAVAGPISPSRSAKAAKRLARPATRAVREGNGARSEEHTSELQSLMRISYAVFCLKKKTNLRIANLVPQSTQQHA